jgi:succinate dehydrogenase/fumarate reductase flavoprotein subunit
MEANQAKAEANMKTHMQEIVAEMKADWDAHVQEVVAKTVIAIEDKMEAIVYSFRSEQDGKIQCQSENVMERKRSLRKGPQWQVWSAKSQCRRTWNLERNAKWSLWKRPQ